MTTPTVRMAPQCGRQGEGFCGYRAAMINKCYVRLGVAMVCTEIAVKTLPNAIDVGRWGPIKALKSSAVSVLPFSRLGVLTQQQP